MSDNGHLDIGPHYIAYFTIVDGHNHHLEVLPVRERDDSVEPCYKTLGNSFRSTAECLAWIADHVLADSGEYPEEFDSVVAVVNIGGKKITLSCD